MQDLIDLIDFIQKTKFKSNTLLEAIIRPDSQLGKMYHAIAEGIVQSDQQLLILFPELVSLAKVTTLKNRLKNRLCDAVFLLDFREEGNPDRQAAFVECVKKWSSAMILISKNIRSIGIKQMENLLRHTLDFEFTEISMNIIRTLELYYGTIEGDQKKYTELEYKLSELEATWLAERETERLYTDLMINYVNARADKHLAGRKALEYYAKAEAHMRRYPAFKIHFFGYLIKTIIYDGQNDYVAMEQVCREAVDFFDRKKYRSGMVLQTFYYHLITCSLYNRQFEMGQPFVRRMEVLLEENSFNWFKLQELYFLMAMHTEKYQVAVITLLKVQANPYLQVQPSHVAEIWKIYEAYIHFLILAGELPPAAPDTPLSNFKISRFLNQIPLLTKDKRGMNITVLIVQFLFFVLQRKQEDCESRTEALGKYCTRYLNDEATVRSRQFIKMLLQIPSCSFDAKQIRLKTTESYQFLEQTPWHTVNQHREIEIIPYEALWLVVLRVLQNPGVAPAAPVLKIVNAQNGKAPAPLPPIGGGKAYLEKAKK